MRIPVIAANWKMNSTIPEAVNLVNQIQPELIKFPHIEKIICPPFISILPIFEIIKGTDTRLGAQNLYYEEKGAYTGEISPLMLTGFCEYVIIGHSERRQLFNETDAIVNKKISSALNNNLKPILCVGENLTEFESGKTSDVVVGQLNRSLNGIKNAGLITIAYEPIWAIGTGKAATGKQANTTISLIRDTLKLKYGQEIAENLRILYGGSVTAVNISEYVSQSDIDGALVGGASLKSSEFISIVKQTTEIRR